MTSSSMAPAIISSTVSAISSCRNNKPQRRAALAGAHEGRAHHIVDHLLRQRGRIDEHGVQAAGLGDQRHDGAAACRQRAIDGQRRGRRAGHRDAGERGMRQRNLAEQASGRRDQVQRLGATPASCSSRTKRAAINGVGSAGFATTAVAGRERRGHLPRKNRQRKIPGTDAGEHAAPVQRQLVQTRRWVLRGASAAGNCLRARSA